MEKNNWVTIEIEAPVEMNPRFTGEALNRAVQEFIAQHFGSQTEVHFWVTEEGK